MFAHSELYLDFALLLMRIMVGLVFAASGLADLRDPTGRGKSIGLPKEFTLFLGAAEALGGAAVIAGILIEPASVGLILIMLGAVQKKIFVWKTGFWGSDGLGWNYELILTSMLLVTLFSGGGTIKPFEFY
jgi:putative oxidoreductase